MKQTKVIYPGKIKTWRTRPVKVFMEIVYEDGKLSITGVEGPFSSGNCARGCGQIEMQYKHRNSEHDDSRWKELIELVEYAPGWNKEMFFTFLEYWHLYHLNGCHAECEHQRKLGWTYKTHPLGVCPECGYKLGSAWMFESVPEDVIEFLFNLPDAAVTPAWV